RIGLNLLRSFSNPRRCGLNTFAFEGCFPGFTLTSPGLHCVSAVIRGRSNTFESCTNFLKPLRPSARRKTEMRNSRGRQRRRRDSHVLAWHSKPRHHIVCVVVVPGVIEDRFPDIAVLPVVDRPGHPRPPTRRRGEVALRTVDTELPVDRLRRPHPQDGDQTLIRGRWEALAGNHPLNVLLRDVVRDRRRLPHPL